MLETVRANFEGFTRKHQYENRLEFLDRREKRSDWDNDELIETEGLIEGTPDPHPGIPNEIPGVGIGGNTNEQSSAVMPEPTQDITDRAALTRANVDAINDTSSIDSPKGVIIDLSGDEPQDSDKFESSEEEGVPNQGVVPKVEPGEAGEEKWGAI